MSIGYELVYPKGTATGLTKRELFAAMAMQGFLSRPGASAETDEKKFDEEIARWSVDTADALLAELEKDQ